MFEKYAFAGILRIFLEEPYKEYHLREIARKTGRSASVAKSALDELAGEGLLVKTRNANLVVFKANTENIVFRHMKVVHSLRRIMGSGLVAFLERELKAQSITLYGGVSRGEDDPGSDIDLLVISKSKKKPDAAAYEKGLKREICVISYTPQEWAKKTAEDKPFYERVIADGIALHGEKPIA
jgi:predicted nucleotidyltransferase